jgi:DNA-binding SARP family transcriptional activator
MVSFRILGPVEVYRDEHRLALAGPRQVALLAFLLVHANRAVSTDRLIDALWADRDPAGAVKRVQVAIGRLRRVLEGGGPESVEPVVRTVAGGYVLAVAPGRLDVEVFRAGVDEGRAAVAEGDPARAAEVLRRALGLWRGPALADVAYEPWAQSEIAWLEELRLAAIESRVEADLQRGRHGELIGELQSLVRDHPTRERMVSELMLALYRTGRQADALAAYRDATGRLMNDLGLEPSPELRDLERAILAHDPALGLPAPELAAPAREAAAGQGAGVELPSGVVTFVLSDIEGSTRLWEGDAEGMARALELHDELLAGAIAAHRGHLLKSKGEGDSTLSVFRRASDGIAAAAEIQAALAGAAWPTGLELRARVALHTGEAHEREGDYFGPAVNRAARLRALARGGATVVSQATTEIVRDRLPGKLRLVDVGSHELPGLSRPERVFELRPSGGAATPSRPASSPARIRLAIPRPLEVATEFPLVGRDRELVRLRELWGRTAGGAHAAIVAGEAGIGKTRLAAELARAVHGEDALVCYGRCDEGLAVPYQPWVEALRPVAGALGPDRLRAEVGRLASDLSRLWPELDALGQPVSADPETERYTLFEAVTALIQTATRAQPALLVLDDLHWAAPPTLLMLRHLIRSDRPLDALVLGTYRETELAADHPLPQLLADLQRDASATTLRIAGLDERGIAALLEAAAGHGLDELAAEFVAALQAQTGGNPFFIREVLAHLLETGTIYRARERWTTDLAAAELEVPEGLRQVIRQRVARLSEPARRALAVAAVAGATVSLLLLEAVLGERSGVLDGLDEAVSAGLLTEAGPGDYAFAHELVRQTIYEQHSTARCLRLHRQLGEALEQRANADAHIEALAHHFAQAAADGQASKAAHYALRAGRNATARVAYEDAAAHYERGVHALELASAPEDERRGELLLALAAARWSSGDMDKAREAARQAAQLAASRGDSEQLARAALSFAGPGRVEVAAAVTGPIVDLLERALDALGERDSALRARVMGRLAVARASLGPGHRRPALAQRALEMARQVVDKRTLVEVLAAGHWVTWTPDNLDERRATAKELARLAAEVGDGALEALARKWSVVNLLELGDIDAAEREFAAYERRADELQQRFPRYLAAVARAGHAHLQGRLADFEALAHEALALGLEGHDESAAQIFGAQMVFLRREQGRLGEIVDAVSDLAERYPEIPVWRCGLADVYAELDRRRDAQRELEALARNDFVDLPRDFVWMLSVTVLSEVVACLDDARHAGPLYELLLPFADRCVLVDGPICLGSASRPLGLLATTARRFDAAAHHFQDALEMNTKIHSPLWVAHTQHDYSRTLLRRNHPGDRDTALKLVEAALATADKLGLKALADKTQRVKRKATSAAST